MPRKLPISVCWIVQNEEEFLDDSIRSVKDFASELVFCDSGSTDKTRIIAESFRSIVPAFQFFERPWTDDYSAARNETAERATHNWVLFIDGDEVLDPAGHEEIERSILQGRIGCYSMIQRNYTLKGDTDNVQLATSLPPPIQHRNEKIYYFENYMERLYAKDTGIKYEGRIHESLLPACSRLNVRHQRLPVILHHFGRLKTDVGDKYLYYLTLSRKKLEEEPENPAAWIEVSVNLMELRQFEAAEAMMKEAVKKFPKEPEIYKSAFQAALRSDQWDRAEQWIRHYLSFFPDDLYSKAQLTTALLYQKKFREMISVADEIFGRDPKNFVAHVNCAVVFFEMKDWKNASRHIQTALAERPNDPFLLDAMNKIPSEFQTH